MRIRYRTGHAAAGLLLAAVSSHALAQGLGEITLESALNEPLRAHIDLLDTDNLDATQIQVTLASQEDFTARGLDRSFLLNSLRFAVSKGVDGNDRIEVTSIDKIDEPYLTFLVSVVWPNGRNLREYTVLLDLPGSNAGAAVAPPQLANPVGNRVPAGTSTSAAEPATTTAASDGYRVQQGDSLYQIAEQTRPSQDVSVQQMMVALQRANEDAFINNNINRILTGKVLRIPTAAEIALIDQAAASAQVAQQNQALMSQPLAVNDSPGNTGASPRDELTLLSGDQAAGGGSSDLDATIAALENELMLSEENLDRARLENLELTNRLAALQEQIDLLQNIIAIEDERIAQLQAELSQQSAATEQALSQATTAEAGSNASGLVGLLRNSVVAIGGLLAVALAAAGLLYMKRRRVEAAAQQDSVALTEIEAEPAAVEKAGLAALLATLMARFRRSDNDESDVDEDDEDNVTAVARVEPVMQAAAPAPAAAPVPAPSVAAASADTNALLDEMGLGEEFRDLNNILDDVDNDAAVVQSPASTAPTAPTTTAAAVQAEVVADPVVTEADLLARALDEAEQQAAMDLLDAPEPTAAAAPESFAFTTEPAVATPAPVADSAAAEKPEVFEFTLPDLDESPTADAAAEQAPLETFSFSPGALAAEPEPPASAAVEDALEVLSFDENSVTLDEGGAEEGYTPAASGQEAHDARLDLAVAYEAMGDIDGAIEILDEVIASGRPAQAAEAERLKQKWQNS